MLTTSEANSLTVRYMARMQAERVGRRASERRKELGLTQQEVADRVGGKTTGNDVSRWERGAVYPDQKLDALAQALETTAADLIAGPVAERKPRGDTPDLPINGKGYDVAELNEIRNRLDEIQDQLERLVEVLGHDLTQPAAADDARLPDPQIPRVAGTSDAEPSEQPTRAEASGRTGGKSG